MGSGPRLATALLIGCYALLLVAWSFADPPGASADEPAHYVKAVAAGHGQIVGAADPALQQLTDTSPQTAWLKTVTRDYEIPAALVPVNFACEAAQPTVSGACHLAPVPAPSSGTVRASSYVGAYDPYLYLIPGLVMRGATTPAVALQLGRLVSAALVLGLLGGAIALLAPWGWGALAGLALALTPMVLFVGSSLNPNGGEIAAGVCFGAACLRLAGGERPPPRVWLVAAAAGAVLALSRNLGPLWVVMFLLLFALLLGPRAALARVRGGGRWSALAVVCIAAGLSAALGWQLATGAHAVAAATGLGSRLAAELHAFPGVILREQVGVFGFVDTLLPKAVYLLWGGLFALVMAGALALGTARERLALLAAGVLSVAVSLGIAVVIIDPTGFPTQGRYSLPFTVIVPMLAGAVIARHRQRLTRPSLLALRAIVVVVALVQLVAWWQNARRYAVGSQGPEWFPPVAQWAPPGGWLPWIAVTVAATALMIAAAAAGRWEHPATA